MFSRWSYPLNERAVAVLGRRLPSATAPAENSISLFPFLAFGRFLSALFLGHCASFPSGWNLSASIAFPSWPYLKPRSLIRKAAPIREPYHSLRGDCPITARSRDRFFQSAMRRL